MRLDLLSKMTDKERNEAANKMSYAELLILSTHGYDIEINNGVVSVKENK